MISTLLNILASAGIIIALLIALIIVIALIQGIRDMLTKNRHTKNTITNETLYSSPGEQQ